jgi:hypothetical protein
VKILFFAPHSAIWNHAFPEALVAEALAASGDEITYVGCGGTLKSHCVSMSAYSVPFAAPAQEKEHICTICRRNLGIIRKRFGFLGPDLAGLASAEDFAAAEALIRATPSDMLGELAVDGVEVGRIALYEMLIQGKRVALQFNEEERERHRASLKNVIVVVRAVKRLLDELKPDRVILYNALYSVNRAVCRLAEIRGIPQYYLHAGDSLANRLQTLVLARNHAFAYYWHLRDRWIDYRDRPCPPEAMRAATDHLLEVSRGRSAWAYSAASGSGTDLRKAFGIGAGQKVLCATMSSDDERFGGEVVGVLPSTDGLLFPKQVDWIRALVEYVESRPELFLVIRVHPREFPNKRESVLSDHALLLREAFAQLPPNARVNWPTENVSLYDLAAITDVFANGWSSAGKEMTALGLPVVLYSPQLVLYPPSLNYVGTTREEYFRELERALADGWDAERIRRTYRWNAVEFHYSPLDISDSFRRDEHASVYKKAIRKILERMAPGFGAERDCRRRARPLGARDRIGDIVHRSLSAAVDLDAPPSGVSLEEETRLLRGQVRRLVEGLYGAAKSLQNNVLADKLRAFADG